MVFGFNFIIINLEKEHCKVNVITTAIPLQKKKMYIDINTYTWIIYTYNFIITLSTEPSIIRQYL